MRIKDKKLFVKLWKAEHQATVKIHQLNDIIGYRYNVDEPFARQQNSLNTWTKKQDSYIDEISRYIKNGTFPENATEQCIDLLGSLTGYVVDCFCAMYQDHKPE